MTQPEAETLANFALKAMPKSSDEQRVVLLAAIEKYPEPVVADAIVQHAAESEFISTPKILERVRAVIGGSNAERMEREALDRLRIAQQISEKRLGQITNAEDPSITRARDFCRSVEPGQLAAWRSEIEAGNPIIARGAAGKETADYLPLACVILTRFGRIPRECWNGVVA